MCVRLSKQTVWLSKMSVRTSRQFTLYLDCRSGYPEILCGCLQSLFSFYLLRCPGSLLSHARGLSVFVDCLTSCLGRLTIRNYSSSAQCTLCLMSGLYTSLTIYSICRVLSRLSFLISRKFFSHSRQFYSCLDCLSSCVHCQFWYLDHIIAHPRSLYVFLGSNSPTCPCF